MSKGDVFNIQRFSLDDGAGIRTIVFLQGCNLHCPWCHNPESIDGKPVIMRNNKCTACGRCVAACPERCIRVGEKHFIDRERCTLCGKCAEACFEDALTICGKVMTADEVMREVMKDKAYYESSGGGITLSGGEPTLQREFAEELLRKSQEQNIATNIETNGVMSDETRTALGKYLDAAMIDMKHIDGKKCKNVLGCSNESVLKTIAEWSKIMDVEVRVPIIPGFNDENDCIEAIYRRAMELGARSVKLLPYHVFGIVKYNNMGIDYAFGIDKPFDTEKLKALANFENNDCLSIY